MKQVSGKFRGIRFAVLLAVLAMVGVTAKAQDAKVASIHGHVNNAAGLMVKDATVRITNDHFEDPKKAKWNYTFPVDENGDYKGTDIAPGTYVVVVYAQDVVVDFFRDQTFKAGEDKLVQFDMTRKDFIDKMTPEQKQQLEEYKKKIADAKQGNVKIANLNALLQQARTDNKAGKLRLGFQIHDGRHHPGTRTRQSSGLRLATPSSAKVTRPQKMRRLRASPRPTLQLRRSTRKRPLRTRRRSTSTPPPRSQALRPQPMLTTRWDRLSHEAATRRMPPRPLTTRRRQNPRRAEPTS